MVESEQAPIELPEGARSITVEIGGLEEVAPQFANIVHVNSDREVFQIVFSQLMPPMIMGDADREAFLDRGTLSARVVARVIVTPPVLQQIIDVLRTQFGMHHDLQGRLSTEPVESANG